MATGDLKGCIRKLDRLIRSLKYPREVNYQGLAKGDPSSCLPIVRYAFISFSSSLAEHLLGYGVELTGTNDLKFIETVYKVLRDLFNYKPLLTKQQFLQFGFAERKMNILCDIIGFVIDKHKMLTKGSKAPCLPKRRPFIQRESREEEEEEPFTESDPQRSSALTLILPGRPLVERHMGSITSTLFSTSSNEQEERTGDEMREEVEEKTEEEEVEQVELTQHAAQECVASGRLDGVEARLDECEARLGRLAALEIRLEAMEKALAGKIIIERSEWENLESRVLLLESRLALSAAQGEPLSVIGVKNGSSGEKTSRREEGLEKEPVEVQLGPTPASVQPTSELSPIPSPNPTAPEENIKERLERIANMMKDTSSLLGNIEPSI